MGAAPPVRIKLNAPSWTLVFKPNESATPDVVGIAWLWTPLLVVVALVLSGIYLSYSRLFRALERDSTTLIDYVTRIVRGRGGNVDRYNLAMFQQIAAAANRYAQARAAGERSAAPGPCSQSGAEARDPEDAKLIRQSNRDSEAAG